MTTSKGGRPATGSIKWMRNAKTGQLHWHGRVTKGDGSRPWAPLDPSIPREDEARARTCAIETAVYFKERPTAGAEVKETVGEWFVRFHKHKEARGLSSVEDMRGRAKKWILPGIEHKDPRAVTREDMEGIVRRLDRAVLAWTKAGGKRGSGVSPSTATNVWGDVVHAFDEMVRAKDPGSSRARAPTSAVPTRGTTARARSSTRTSLWPCCGASPSTPRRARCPSTAGRRTRWPSTRRPAPASWRRSARPTSTSRARPSPSRSRRTGRARAARARRRRRRARCGRSTSSRTFCPWWSSS